MSSQIWRQYRKCHFLVLLAKLNITICWDASEVYDYSCFIVVVVESASRSCLLASKVLPPWDVVDPRMNVHLPSSFSKLHTFCVDRSHLTLDLAIRSILLFLSWTTSSSSGWICSKISDQESSPLSHRLALPCNCWVIIAKPYQVVPHLLTSWPLIDMSSLKPVADSACWICLIVCNSLVHRLAHLHVTPLSMVSLSQSLRW
jgi:hypothetical protein